MKRAISLIVVTLSLLTGFLPHPARAFADWNRIETHNPVWLSDGEALLVMVDQPVPVTALSEARETRRHLFAVSADGRWIRPVNIGAVPSSVSPDGGTRVLAQLDLWKMDAGRAETLRLFWGTPPGEVLYDVRLLADDTCRALTWAQGFLRLHALDPGGRKLAVIDFDSSIYAWSESGDGLLLGGFGGVDWYVCRTGKRIGGGGVPPIEPDELGFLADGTGRAYCRIGGRYFILWLDRESLRSQPAPDGFVPEPSPRFSSMPGYAGSIDFVLPGPGNLVVAGDGKKLFSLSLDTGRIAGLTDLAPKGRGVWSRDGEAAYFESQGRIMRYSVSTGKIDTLAAGCDPALSPSGRHLAFAAPVGNDRMKPALLDLDRGGVKVLEATGLQPVWLSDESLIYIGYIEGNWQLCQIAPSEEHPRVLSSFSFYSVQLQAFPVEKEALDFARDVEARLDAAEPVFVQDAVVKGTRWYRVRLGLCRTASNAAALARQAAGRLKGLEGWQGNCFVTPTENCFGRLQPLPNSAGLIFEIMGALYRYDADAKTFTPLYMPKPLSAAPVRDIALSPDGKRIAFISENGDLVVMPASGGGSSVLFSNRGF